MSASEAQSRRMAVCEMCRGNGIIPVRTINGAVGRVIVTKEGVPHVVAVTDRAQVRCRCTKGERFKQFPEFDHHYCVSLLPGGEAIAQEVGPVQQEIPF